MRLKLNPAVRLSRIVGKSTAAVNSAHHQAVYEIGEGFVVNRTIRRWCHRSDEKIHQRSLCLGVQYHPERMFQTAESREHRRKLFEAFIEAASSL